MVISDNREQIKIEIEGVVVKQVRGFKYLGVIIDGKGLQEIEIEEIGGKL